jgi:hypothetical protein
MVHGGASSSHAAASERCMITVSSQRSNLKPTSRSVPT